MRLNKICPYCSSSFAPKRNNQLYCTSKHGWDHRNSLKICEEQKTVFAALKYNDRILKILFTNKKISNPCHRDILISHNFDFSYYSQIKTIDYFEYNVVIQYAFLEEENEMVKIKKV